MAIDSANKRRSCISLPPAPDSSISKADRLQIAGLYCGNIPITTCLMEARSQTAISAEAAITLGIIEELIARSSASFSAEAIVNNSAIHMQAKSSAAFSAEAIVKNAAVHMQAESSAGFSAMMLLSLIKELEASSSAMVTGRLSLEISSFDGLITRY